MQGEPTIQLAGHSVKTNQCSAQYWLIGIELPSIIESQFTNSVIQRKDQVITHIHIQTQVESALKCSPIQG